MLARENILKFGFVDRLLISIICLVLVSFNLVAEDSIITPSVGYEKNAVDLNFKVFNPESKGDPIILVHGMDSAWQTWKPVIENLNDHPIYAVDLRGHGESSAGNFDFSTPQMIADLHSFVQKQGLKGFILFGHSMGARITVPFSAAYPDLVKAVVIEDMDMEPRQSGRELKAEELNVLKNFKTIHPDEESIYQELRKVGYENDEIASLMGRRIFKLPNGSYKIGFYPYLQYLSGRNLMGSADGLEAFKKIAQRSVPTLLIRARTIASACSDSGLRQMQDIMPRLVVRQLAGSGHNVHGTDINGYLAAVKAFFGDIGSGTFVLPANSPDELRMLQSVPDIKRAIEFEESKIEQLLRAGRSQDAIEVKAVRERLETLNRMLESIRRVEKR